MCLFRPSACVLWLWVSFALVLVPVAGDDVHQRTAQRGGHSDRRSKRQAAPDHRRQHSIGEGLQRGGRYPSPGEKDDLETWTNEKYMCVYALAVTSMSFCVVVGWGAVWCGVVWCDVVPFVGL